MSEGSGGAREGRASLVVPVLVLVTDPRWSIEHTSRVVARAAAALGPGRLMVQLRDKGSPIADLRSAAIALRRVTEDSGALLCMNAIRESPSAALAIAAEVAADAAHVACEARAVAEARRFARWISTPSHSDEDVERAELAGADALLVSPIFESPGKGPPRGPEALRSARRGRSRVYALGGVTADKAQMCARAGAHGLAVIRALLDAHDPAERAMELAKPFLAPAEGV